MRAIPKSIIMATMAIAMGICALADNEITAQAACPPVITEWLIDNAVPFDTTNPAAPIDDLEPLRAIIGDARIVALGEQTHGTREFFEMKHRIFRFLVEEMGFRLFAFEADWLGLIEINACLLPGGPQIETAFRNLGFWTWQTNEVMALLQWMRAYNEEHPAEAPVQLLGLDIMLIDSARRAVLDARTYIEQVNLDPTDEMLAILSYDFPFAFRYLSPMAVASSMDSERVEQYVNVLEPVITWMEASRDACVAASSEYEYLITLRGLELATSTLHMLSVWEDDSAWTVRDGTMAENVTWWLDFLGESKLVIWAHNAHVARDFTSTAEEVRMGEFLGETYGTDYLPIGFSFAEGSLTAGQHPYEATAEPLIEGCYEAAFQTTGLPRFIIDLRGIEPESAVGEWMYVERSFRAIGSVYGLAELGWEHPLILPESYDVIIHIETSTAAVQWSRY